MSHPANLGPQAQMNLTQDINWALLSQQKQTLNHLIGNLDLPHLRGILHLLDALQDAFEPKAYLTLAREEDDAQTSIYRHLGTQKAWLASFADHGDAEDYVKYLGVPVL